MEIAKLKSIFRSLLMIRYLLTICVIRSVGQNLKKESSWHFNDDHDAHPHQLRLLKTTSPMHLGSQRPLVGFLPNMHGWYP